MVECTVSFLRLQDLTLTSVVFEFGKFTGTDANSINLTLTSVVFEYTSIFYCLPIDPYLTLTSVVFE